jgi:hypothetical protein
MKGGHFKTRAQKLLFLQRCHESLKDLPYNTLELAKIEQFINDHSENLKLKPDITTNSHYLKSAPVKPCACADCSKICHINVTSSLLDPFSLYEKLLPVFKELENKDFHEKINLLSKFKCSKAKYILSQHLITLALEMCLDKEILHFQDKKVIIFPFYNEDKHFYVQIEANQIMIKNSEELHFKPHEIIQFDLNFTSNVKNLPQLQINEDLPILICPDVLQSSQITVSKISLYNTKS